MNTLLILDKKDYTTDMQVIEKYSTRAVIIRGGRIAMQRGAAGDYKILGGGVELGEEYVQALCREVQEESGLIVIPDSVRELGEIVERRRDVFDPAVVFECHSLYYLCEAQEEVAEPRMTESEIAKGYHLCWATPEEIVAGNEGFCDSCPWIDRDTRFIRMLPELIGAV